MTRLSPDQIDRQLGDWLREESLTRAPAGLVEDVFARTSRVRQVRRWWPPVAAIRSRLGQLDRAGAVTESASWRGTPVWGAIGIVLVVVALALTLRPAGIGPGINGSPTASPSPAPVATPTPSPTSTATPAPTPVPTVLDSFSAQRLVLGTDAGPISAFEAFGSIWVADIHANDVRRLEPGTMRELDRITVPGAAWFAVADGALWVTSQTGTGLSRIDPATNTVVDHVGDVAPCAAPVVAFDSIWQSACDADVILRIDPVRNVVTDTIPAKGHGFLVLAGGRLITVGPQGLASFDPETGSFTEIDNPAAVGAELLTSDGTTVWVSTIVGMTRIDPADGRTVASFPAPLAKAISFADDHAWMAVTGQGVLEIDLATNKVTRTIPVLPAPLVPLEAGGVLWVTDFENSVLWRIEL